MMFIHADKALSTKMPAAPELLFLVMMEEGLFRLPETAVEDALRVLPEGVRETMLFRSIRAVILKELCRHALTPTYVRKIVAFLGLGANALPMLTA